MELLIAILIQLGVYYTPDEVEAYREQDPIIERAQTIIDEGRYYYGPNGGVVIEDDVDPNN